MIKFIDNEKKLFLKLLFKKNIIETSVFIGCIIIVLWIELTNYRFHINTSTDFNKINSLISNFSLAYIASYIFWLTNNIFKYMKDIRIIYPQLKSITYNLLAVHDTYIKDLKRFYKDIPLNVNKSFDLNEESLSQTIKDAKKHDVLFKSLCGANYQTAAQIHYDIDLLLKYTTYLDTSFLAMIMDIGRNPFIIQHKMSLRDDLYIFECLQQDVIRLSEQVNKLREYTKKEFGEILS